MMRVVLISLVMLVSCSQDTTPKDPPLDIILFAGGSPDFFFSEAIANGAQKAAAETNVNLEVVWSEWRNDLFVTQFKESIDKGPDGIAIMGHPGDNAMKSLVDEAYRKGIKVTTLNVNLPQSESQYKPVGFGYVGQQLKESSELLVNAAIRKFDLKAGDKAIVMGVAQLPVRGIRTTAGMKILEDHGVEIVYFEDPIGVDFETQEEDNRQAFLRLLDENPDAKIVFDDINLDTSVEAMKSANIDPDALITIGFDLSPTVAGDIKAGYIDMVSDQQPFLQGYFAVKQLVLSARWQFGGLSIDTGTGIITKENLVEIEAFVEEGIR